ncbi:hypothetical protein Dimus_013929 [Dionaea muscipula]
MKKKKSDSVPKSVGLKNKTLNTTHRVSRNSDLKLSLSPSPARSAAMPRRSSGRSARPAPRQAAARSPAPQPVHHAPPPPPVPASGGSMLGGLGQTIAQGLAFGTGSAVAHRAVDSVLGPRTIQHETVGSEATAAPAPMANSTGGADACGFQSKAFQDCLNSYGSDISKCQFYLDMLNECKRSSGSVMGV